MQSSCYRHPERRGQYYCQKDSRYMCDECAHCYSPNVYCQFRTACTIDLLKKEEGHTPSEAESGRKEGREQRG